MPQFEEEDEKGETGKRKRKSPLDNHFTFNGIINGKKDLVDPAHSRSSSYNYNYNYIKGFPFQCPDGGVNLNLAAATVVMTLGKIICDHFFIIYESINVKRNVKLTFMKSTSVYFIIFEYSHIKNGHKYNT